MRRYGRIAGAFSIAAGLGCAAPEETVDPTTTATDATSSSTRAESDESSTSSTSGGGETHGPSSTETSGSGTSSGSTSDAAEESTGDGPASDCASLPLCDGFETAAVGGPPDAATWSVVSPNCSGTGTLAVTDEAAHGGSRSVRIDGGSNYCDHAFISNTAAVASVGDVVWARFWVRLESALGAGHVTFATLTDHADGDHALRLGGQAEIVIWNRESDDATLPSLSPAGIATSTAPQPGEWTCIELMIDASGGLETYVGGERIDGLVVDATPTPDVDAAWQTQSPGWQPDVTDLRLGWEAYGSQSMVLYVDDVAVASDRIGCE